MTPRFYLLQIQKFLKGYGDPDKARESLKLRFKIDITEDYLEFKDGSIEPVWIYNYDPIRSRGTNVIENEARGLILNKDHDVVSLSFKRFFNAHEQHACDIDWATARAERKADGSLVTIYSYKGEYFISTRNSAMASGRLPAYEEFSFGSAILEYLEGRFEGNPFAPFEKHNNGEKYCWVFEFVSPFNRLVTRYYKPELILLSTFNKNTCAEVAMSCVNMFASLSGFKRPETHMVYSEEQVDKLIDVLHPLEEGFVVVDIVNRRVKIKNPTYINISKAINAGAQLSLRHFADIVLSGDGPEVAAYFPDYRPILEFLQEVLEDILENVDELWKEYRDIKDRKEFAEKVHKFPFSFLLFDAWDGKITTPEEAIEKIKTDVLIKAARHYQERELDTAFQKALYSR
jgi:hypothetical protein